MDITFEQAKMYGFDFPQARSWYEAGRAEELARDASLITKPGAAIPAELLAYIDPKVIEIMTAPRRARELFTETKKGDWTTPYAKWRTDEIVGRSQPYSDFAASGVSDLNCQWRTRQQYVFQTSIHYGDLESAMTQVARLDLAAARQRAAATVLDIDANRFYLLGVQGLEIYGLLNDPDLPPAIVAAPTGGGGSSAWADKTTRNIYDDVLSLFSRLVAQSSGLIDNSSELILALSPSLAVFLGGATDFNVSVLEMLNKYFGRIRIVTLPELSSPTAGETVFMIAPTVSGLSTGDLGFGEKIRAGRLVAELSSLKQKYVSSTYGGIVLIPFAFAQMTGV
ncbi:MAG: major capsid family protein [Candidatus Adiutrix sp.]